MIIYFPWKIIPMQESEFSYLYCYHKVVLYDNSLNNCIRLD